MCLADITVPPQNGAVNTSSRISFLLVRTNAAVHGQWSILVTDPFVTFTLVREGRGSGEIPQFKDSPINCMIN